MRKITLILAAVLLISLLTGCLGTTVVYYSDCTCPVAGQSDSPASQPNVEGALKTGLYIATDIKSEKAGQIKYDVTMIAVTVDEQGVIVDCIIDSLPATFTFDNTGAITTDLTAPILSKNELGENYGMKKYGNARYEWDVQAKALADFAKGKTVAELKKGAVGETGYAMDVDLASTATIYLGGYVSGIEQAVASARNLGAQAGDELRFAAIATFNGSKAAAADKNGTAQMDVDVTALTVKDGIITSCYIDAVQSKISFRNDGTLDGDLPTAVPTKNQLGEDYGMKKYANARYEWSEQAAAFAAYVTGKTPAQVAGIAVSEGVPSEADLSTTVTIRIGGFQALIAKATK